MSLWQVMNQTERTTVNVYLSQSEADNNKLPDADADPTGSLVQFL